MENTLLQKEEEFHKVNEELELKMKELLKEVEGVLKIQDKLSNSDNSSGSKLKSPKQSSASQLGTGDDTDFAMSTEGLVRVLRAKVKALQDEMEALSADYKKRTEDWHKLQKDMKCIEEDRNRWQHQAAALKECLRKQEKLTSSATARQRHQELENSSLKKEVDSLKKELRTAVQTSMTNEVRLNRSLEELEKLRTTVESQKRDNAELRNLTRKRGDEVATIVKKLERQKSELLHAFHKQLQLIDNLKRQKVHLEAACMMQFTEQEFLKLLEWCPKK